MDFLFGADTPLAVRFFIAFVIVLGLIGGTAYLVRRFGGERLATAGRGRQPRLAVVDAAAVDGRRRLILIRRDNVEHLLLIGGPSDVVVEPNILRAAASREAPAPRPPAPSEAIARPAAPVESMWPLQPQAEPAPVTASLAGMPSLPRQQRPVAEEPAQWQPEPEPPAPPQRQSRAADPLAGLAAELARTTPAEPAAAPAAMPIPVPRRPARVSAREPARVPVREVPSEAPHEVSPESQHAGAQSGQGSAGSEPQVGQPSDQNLADMAQRLEAALRRPSRRPEDMRIAEFGPKVPLTALDPLPGSSPPEPRPMRSEVRPLRAEPPRMEPPRTDVSRSEVLRAEGARTEFTRTEGARPEPNWGEVVRAEIPRAETTRAEATRAEPQWGEVVRADIPRADYARAEPPPRAEPQRAEEGEARSLYDSLEQEMASLLSRPNKN